MGVKWDDESDLSLSELITGKQEREEPIAKFLGKFSSTLKAAQKAGSPQGFAGPGVLDQLYSAATGAKRGTMYNATLPGTELAFDLVSGRGLPVTSFIKRFFGNAGQEMFKSALQGEGGATGFFKGFVGGGLGAAAEPVTGVIKQKGAQRLAGEARDAIADKGLKQAEGIRVQDLVDQQAWEKTKAALEAKDALAKSEGKAAVAQRNLTREQAYSERLRNREVEAFQDAKATRKLNRTRTEEHAKEVAAQQKAYEAAVLSHQDMAAKSIMDDAKSVVPEWAELPSNLKGIVEITTGKGKALSQAAFEKAYTEAFEAAKGHPVFLNPDDIAYFRLPVNKGGRANLADGTTIESGSIDAGDLIKAMNEKPFKNRDWTVYERASRALADQGVGIPAEAREAYKNAMGFADYIQNSGAIKEGVLDTDRLVKAMYDVKTIEAVRRRSMGDAFTGPFQAARIEPEMPSGVPAPPAPIPKPVKEPVPLQAPKPQKPVMETYTPPPASEIPPKPVPTEIGNPLSADDLDVVKSIPIPGSPTLRATVGALAGSLLSQHSGWNPYNLAPMAAAGWAAGRATPNEWITKAPGLQDLSNLIGELAKPYTTVGRDAVMQGLEALELFTPTDPAQEAAEIQARLDALKRPSSE